MQSIEEALNKLKKSKFRSSFHLDEKDLAYIKAKGLDTIESHAHDFVRDRLVILREDDGKQTPMKGHPVFKAMHATGCCCRGCLNKWYKVAKDVELNEMQQEKIVRLLMAWIMAQEKEKENESVD